MVYLFPLAPESLMPDAVRKFRSWIRPMSSCQDASREISLRMGNFGMDHMPNHDQLPDIPAGKFCYDRSYPYMGISPPPCPNSRLTTNCQTSQGPFAAWHLLWQWYVKFAVCGMYPFLGFLVAYTFCLQDISMAGSTPFDSVAFGHFLSYRSPFGSYRQPPPLHRHYHAAMSVMAGADQVWSRASYPGWRFTDSH